jgi:hypothetical protein
MIGNEGAATGQVYGVSGLTYSAGNFAAGVGGYEGAATGQVYGVIGDAISNTNNAVGVYGNEEATTGHVFGVFGAAASTTTNAAGVDGLEYATTGVVFGVSGGVSSTTNGASGVSGYEGAATGQVSGVSGSTGSTSNGAAGVVGIENATYGQVYGVYGSTSTNTEYAAAVNGFEGASTGQVYGVSGTTSSNSGFGVNGVATATDGAAYGVVGVTASAGGFGVYGIHNSSGYGLAANNALAGTGVSLGGPSLLIVGYKLGNNLFTVDASGNGYFAGDLNVTGKVSKGSGSFKIDHPLDPANKYLSHSFVESPDMMNVYNGNITTDRHGVATVVLPDYFQALNRDFRYQLTVIGQFAQAIVAKEIDNNRFVIRTSQPGVKVSWQVTGIRQDAYANANRIPVDEDKPAEERGLYLHPEVFGQPANKGVSAAVRRASTSDTAQSGSR